MAAILFFIGLGLLLTFEEAGVFLLPGDISLVAAGLHASPHLSYLLYSWLAGSVGMVLGASVLFHGVSRANSFKKILPPRVRRLIRRHGIWGVAVARLIPGLRNATVFAAATSRMSYGRFLWGLVPAAMIWSGLLLLLGWFGGDAMLSGFGSWHQSRPLQLVSLAILLAIVSFVWWRLRGTNRAQSAQV